jgi:hypothetical protein
VKPGRKDIRLEVLITGAELAALKDLADLMCEAYGLDRRIRGYRGVRPIGLHRWDMDCLLDVIFFTIRDESDKDSPSYRVLAGMHDRLRSLYEETWDKN